MTWSELKEYIKADFYRRDGQRGGAQLLRAFLKEPDFRYVFLLRICQFWRQTPVTKFTLYPFARWWFARMGVRYGIRIPLSCTVGKGFVIGHWGCIWVGPAVVFGKNCTISHNITLGSTSRGPTAGGLPVIGDHVFISPGAVVLGRVRVGNHALLSSNSVVLQDVADNSVMIGVPARPFSQAGSAGYVAHTDYE